MYWKKSKNVGGFHIKNQQLSASVIYTLSSKNIFKDSFSFVKNAKFSPI